MYEKALERQQTEADRMALAVRQGLIIARDRDALTAFQRRIARRSGSVPKTAAQQRATLQRLAAIPGLSVKVN